MIREIVGMKHRPPKPFSGGSLIREIVGMKNRPPKPFSY